MFKIGRVRIEPGGVVLIVLLTAVGICMWHGHTLSQALDKANHDHVVVPAQKALSTQECKNITVEAVNKGGNSKTQHPAPKPVIQAVHEKTNPMVSTKQELPRIAACPAVLSANATLVTVGTEMTLDAIHFRRNSARLDLDGKKLLLVFSKQLSEQSAHEKFKLDVMVEGHADSTGKPDRNLRLSQHRAQSVKKFLQDHLPSGSNIAVSSQGDTKPSGDNKTYDGREMNRRVELHVIKK